MGITDIKLFTDSDSQVKAADYLVKQGFTVLVRFYHEPICTEAVPDNQIEKFVNVGVRLFEGYVNEPEIEWRRPPLPEVIEELAKAHIRFADACYRVNGNKPGIVPLTPAMQGDRWANWFEPFIKRIIDLGRRDCLNGSAISCHPRPVNNLPLADPPGFVPRSYELFDDVVKAHLGHSLDIYATEWGYEPGDNANKTLPVIDLDNHAEYNRQLAVADWRPCLKVGYYWTWLDDWAFSGWWHGDVARSLPVVRVFLDMKKPPAPVEPVPAIIPFSEWAANLALANSARAAVLIAEEAFPILQKDAAAGSQCALPTSFETQFEWQGGKFIVQGFGMGKLAFLVVRQLGQYLPGDKLILRRNP
jgi:hypothetical protein